MSYSVGETVEGTVTGVTAYGAFVGLEDGSVGMIHISKLSNEFVSDINAFIKKGDRVKATVISLDNQKIALSMIADNKPKAQKVNKSQPQPTDFESMLSMFKTASDERQKGLMRDKKRRK